MSWQVSGGIPYCAYLAAKFTGFASLYGIVFLVYLVNSVCPVRTHKLDGCSRVSVIPGLVDLHAP